MAGKYLVVVVACLIALLIITEAKDIIFKDCGSTGAKIKTIDVTPCPSYPCVVTKGKNSSIVIDFESIDSADNITAKVTAIIQEVKFPFPLPQPDACKDSGLTCPLKANQEYQYILTLVIPSFAPSGLTVIAEIELVSAGANYLCAEVAIKVA